LPIRSNTSSSSGGGGGGNSSIAASNAAAAAAAKTADHTSKQWPHLPRRSVAASDDNWRIEMKYAFPGPTATRCCSSLLN